MTQLTTFQVFFRTAHSFAFVNLKPILPGHVLVSPIRVVPRLRDLSPNEILDLFLTVQKVGNMVERVFKGSALNIATQDGEAAGQSVKHVHVHLIPRSYGDMDKRGGGDALYEMLEGEEGDVGTHQRELGKRRGGLFPKVDDTERAPRSEEEMQKEAEWLAREMETET